MDLRQSCMLVSLTIRMWQGQKIDRPITNEVHEKHNVEHNAGKYVKNLIAPQHFKKLIAASSALRSTFYHYTLPWSDNGQRILTTIGFIQFTEALNPALKQFDDAKIEFIRNFLSYKDEAKKRLAGLYNEYDYPGVMDLDRMFHAFTSVLPIPSAADFRADVGETERERIKADIEEKVHEQIDLAQKEVAERIHRVCSHMVERLSKFERTMDNDGNVKINHPFRDTLVTNIRELVAVLPALNVTGSSKINHLIDEMREKLVPLDPAQLRDSQLMREMAVQEAMKMADIAKAML